METKKCVDIDFYRASSMEANARRGDILRKNYFELDLQIDNCWGREFNAT